MTDDRSLERAARSWLEAGPTEAPDRAVEAAILRIQTTPQERDLRIPWRLPKMTTPARVATAAVIGVLVVGGAFLMLGRLGQPGVGGPGPTATPTESSTPIPSATPSPSATAVPAVALPAGGPISAGRYVMRMADTPVDVEFTVGTGWVSGGWYISTDGHSISFWTIPKVYTDACDTGTAPDNALGGTVEDLVAALDGQANTDMSEPVEVVIDGHPGVRVELSPSDGRPEPCVFLTLWTLPDGTPGRGIDTLAGDPGEPGDPGELVQPVWILDVDGERVVFVGWDSMLGQADPNAIADVIESMTLTRR